MKRQFRRIIDVCCCVYLTIMILSSSQMSMIRCYQFPYVLFVHGDSYRLVSFYLRRLWAA